MSAQPDLFISGAGEPNLEPEAAVPMPSSSAAMPLAADPAPEAGPEAPAPQPKQHKSAAVLLPLVPPPTEADRPITLQACLNYLQTLPTAPASLLQQSRSAVTSAVRSTGKAATELPADPQLLRPILAAVMPAAHRISPKTWANAKSGLGTLLFHCGWVAPEARREWPQRGAWPTIIAAAATVMNQDRRGPLLPFARFCAVCGRDPQHVTQVDLAAYEAWRLARTLDLKPRQTVIATRLAWNRLAAAHVELGLQALGIESRVCRKMRFATEFSVSFQRELDAYLAFMRHPDPLNPDHPRPYSERSVQHARRSVLRAATYLTHSGIPAGAIGSLAELVSPAAFRTVLGRLHEEAGGRWSQTAVLIAANLLMLARHWVRPGPEALKEVETLRRRVRVPRTGLSRKIRDRLAQFATDEDRRELFALPGRGFEAADRMLRAGRSRQAATLHEAALALAILLTQPMRRENLASIDIAEHLVRDRRHRLQRIVITKVKNRRDIDVLLSQDLVARIERHIAVFRPLVPGHDTGSALFPGPKGGARNPESIGRIVRNLVARQLGAAFNLHLARHLAAEMLLDDNPNNIFAAQRLLGHASPKTTAAAYGISRTSAAQKVYAGLVDSLKEKAAARARRRSKRTRS